ncbi:hypothetical protein [Guptibacillus hwajinpoensis]|uniref:Peptide/nickel transport system permease protein n=1 Tax=Guptibacillus hwajinpoensis TaxID=208199 RepID=A0ABU0K3R0_9BACL|nr:hypothetical protein [Alkalihalobacillus hemicentroti]MDQ0483929.1 peptide/nickel transport system permease protein [Alkalihalobacillus hemicentroti]
MRFFELFYKYVLGVIGIVLISCISVFFTDGFQLNVNLYFQNVWGVIKSLFTPSDWYFYQFVGYELLEKPLFSYVLDNYLYSMTILFAALVIAIVFGMVFALSTFGLPHKMKRAIHTMLNGLEALPDILFIFILQMVVVWFFKTYDILLFEFAYIGERIYLSPILSLCILPTVLFYRVFLFLLEQEWKEDYVQLVRSKGFSKMHVLIRHCLRNIKISLVIQSRPIVWVTLSSLLVIEYLHNFYGIVRLIFFDSRPFVIAMALILIFTPFYIIYSVLEWSFKLKQTEEFSDSRVSMRGMKLFSMESMRLANRRMHFFSSIKKMSRYFVSLCKKPTFIMALIYLLGLTILSFMYSYMAEVPVNTIKIFQDEQGTYHAPPHPPGDGGLLLGSDTHGHPILSMLIVGAKYTILLTALIAFLRILIGYMLSIPYLFWLGNRSKRLITNMADGMQFLPLSLIAYILLVRVLIFNEDQRIVAESFRTSNIMLEVSILILFAIPVVLNTIGREADEILRKDFAQAAILLGGSKSRLFFRHITVHLFPKLVHLFGQQMIQALQVLMHLGVFGILLGGGLRSGGAAYQSLTYEWTGMFQALRMGIMTERYWLIVPVLILYVLLIFSIQAVVKSIITIQQQKIGIYSSKEDTKVVDNKGGRSSSRVKELNKDSFVLIERS